MQKSIYSPEHRQFLDLLKEAREVCGISQTELAARLEWEQTLVSRTERGARRLDVLELRHWLAALDVELVEFVAELQERLQKNTQSQAQCVSLGSTWMILRPKRQAC